MTMGGGLFLFAVGAILRYAIKDSWQAVDLTMVGLILMFVGAVGFVVGAIYTAYAMWSARGRSGPGEAPTPPTQRRY
jgi:hypothetical protein